VGLAAADRAIFDKTGTLTRGHPTLVQLIPSRGHGESELLEIAQRLERDSEHPFARAIVCETALVSGPSASPMAAEWVEPVASTQSIPGFGVEGTVADKRYRIGRPEWASSLALNAFESTIPGPAALAWVLLADEEGPLAWFGLEDPIRLDAATAIDGLREQGLALEMLSGDPSPFAARVAERLELEVVRAGATPEDKVARVRELQAGGERVVVVGDGVNDGPFLAAGDVSVAMGSGCDLSRMGADAVLMRDELSLLPRAVAWSGRVRRILFQNFGWAIGYNVLALPLAVSGQLPPWLAALGMSTSSLVVVLNALRLNRLPEAP
jgi:Cu2+-exporting ATPase